MARKRGRRLRFHLPFTAPPPPLVSEATGFVRLLQRPARGKVLDTTILDTPDNRLLRAGVVVAHRVLDGLGEWYLSAPGWAPRLPEELVVPLGATGELPPEIATLIRPIARGSMVGPVAALSSERHQYDLLGADGAPLAAIRDELVTVRRGGVATARYREATVTPSAEMSPQQREFVLQAMDSVSATHVHHFPTLQQRIGPPATGLTDFPEPQSLGRGATMEDLVTSIFATDLRSLTFTLLDLAGDEEGSLAGLNAELEGVRRDVRGLAHVLEPAWREAVEHHLAGLPFERRSEAISHALEVQDALVTGVRAPKLGDASQQEAAPLLFRRAEQATFILADRCRVLDTGATAEQWQAALTAAQQLALSAAVGGGLLGRRARKPLVLLEEIADRLARCVDETPGVPDLEGLGVDEAYALGEANQRRHAVIEAERAAFVELWPSLIRRLRKQLQQARGRA